MNCITLKTDRFPIQFCWVFCGNVFQSVNLDTIDWLHTLNNIKRCLRYLRTSKIIRHYTLVQHFLMKQAKHKILRSAYTLTQVMYKCLVYTLYTLGKKGDWTFVTYTIINFFLFVGFIIYSCCCVNKQMSHKCFAFGSPCMIYEVIFQLIVFVVWKHCYDSRYHWLYYKNRNQ